MYVIFNKTWSTRPDKYKRWLGQIPGESWVVSIGWFLHWFIGRLLLISLFAVAFTIFASLIVCLLGTKC